MTFRLTYFLFIVFLSAGLRGQELPPISNYSADHYQAGNQNWDISQDQSRNMYIANNEGLLVYNGATWQLYPMPNNSIVRSVHGVGDKVFTGCYMDFGYWSKDDSGALVYHSIVQDLGLSLIEDEQIWTILSTGNIVLFQSFDRIFIYDLEKNDISSLQTGGLLKMYQVGDRFYYQDEDYQIFEIINEGIQPITTFDSLGNNKVINLFEINGDLFALTEKQGFYKLSEGVFQRSFSDLDSVLKGLNIYSAIKLSDGTILIGTISRGLVRLNREGQLVETLDQNLGLGNNTVLSLYEDARANVWAGLDNGVDLVNIAAPIRIFNDKLGKIGSVYATAQYNGKLYLGTNQGLFVSNDNPRTTFDFVPGTNGQVWSLFVYDDVLFCGHNEGTFIVNKDRVRLVTDIEGTWNLQAIKGRPDLILQGNFDGISYLQKNEGQWQFGGVFSGFDISARYFVPRTDQEYWVNHEYKGLYKLKLDLDNFSVKEISLDSTQEKGLHSGLTRYKNSLLYGNKQGVFKLEQGASSFVKDSVLSKPWSNPDDYLTGKIILDTKENIWTFSNDYVNYFKSSSLGSNMNLVQYPLSNYLSNVVHGFENVSQLEDGRHVFGTTNGYVILDSKKYIIPKESVRIERVQFSSKFKDSVVNSEQKNLLLPSSFNSVVFSYSSPTYNAYLNTEYQHRLNGAEDESWGDWSKAGQISYDNLTDGTYKFEVRYRQGSYVSEQISSYSFMIKTPWYRTTLAFVIYILGFAFLIFAIHNIYTAYYRRQREKLIEDNKKQLSLRQLESERQIIQLRNESLKQAVESKNKELAVSTMAMIKKNELLNAIKKELFKYKEGASALDLKEVTKIIDRSLLDKKDWKVFEEAFNNTDKDFITKLKSKHPKLTSNDLKLCTFLRLNLTSKEMAPLLNISPRSVEIKRYRLRKKMELESTVNLTDYILQF